MDKESVFNIHPEYFFTDYLLLYNNKYDFLNFIDENINFEKYYNYLNSLNEYKIKNLFYFFNLKLKTLNINYKFKNDSEINYELTKFIDNKKINGIIIINLISKYYH